MRAANITYLNNAIYSHQSTIMSILGLNREFGRISKAEFTLTEKKAEKRKSIRIRGKTEIDKRNVPTITASSDWLPLFHQDVNPA